VDVNFELTYALRGESMRDSFALSRVLGSVSGVEQASLYRDECIVEIAITMLVYSKS
jgi:hypothetical protein